MMMMMMNRLLYSNLLISRNELFFFKLFILLITLYNFREFVYMFICLYVYTSIYTRRNDGENNDKAYNFI